MYIEMPQHDQSNYPWEHLRLPPFPQTALTVMQLANEPDSSLDYMDRLISSDVAFATEVLAIANSYLYGSRVQVICVLHAIARLGTNRLRGICMTVGARAYLGRLLRRPSMRAIWRHNLACAFIAEQIAAAGFIDSDSAYTAGILHDIGRLALAVMNPTVYEDLLQSHIGKPDSISDRERELFGLDHCQLGRKLISDWRLPSDFEAIAADHHLARSIDGTWSMAELTKVSCRFADAMGFAAFQGCAAMPYEELFNDLPDRERKFFPSCVDELRLRIENNLLSLEAA